jgi:hypothetical protein
MGYAMEKTHPQLLTLPPPQGTTGWAVLEHLTFGNLDIVWNLELGISDFESKPIPE